MSDSPLKVASLRPATRAVHGGERMELGTAKPTVNPLHFSTSFVHDSSDDRDAVFDDPAQGYVYARYGNPTVRALEEAMAGIENADAAISYPSGMAAVNGVFQMLARPGDHVVISRDVYGSTLALMNSQFSDTGVNAHFVDVTDLEALRRTVADIQPTLVFAETISNPLIKVTDIQAVVDIARDSGAKVVIDNTFASPMLVRPTDLGADLTLHSTTKYIAGHGDVLGGVVSGSRELVNRLRDLARVNGAVPGPFDAWLCSRGLKTLHLRMHEHSANARNVVEWLEQDERISRVYYPDTNVASGQFLSNDRGGMVGFEVNGLGRQQAFRYLESLKIIEPAPTLGDVCSLSLHPATSSHRGLTPEQREEWGIRDNLVRLSVGIEDAGDIIADLDQAIAKALG